MLAASTRTRNCTRQKPGSVATLGGMSSGGLAVNTTLFGSVLTPWLVVNVVGQSVVRLPSPSYWTMGPSSVHGATSGKVALQSTLNWKLLMVSFVPPWMLPLPTLSMMSTVSPMGVSGGALT